jgi:hypothetical protein
MTVLNRIQSVEAAVVVAAEAADTESGPRRRAAIHWHLAYRWLSVSLLAGLLIATAAGEFAKPADARGTSDRSIGGGTFAGHASSSFGRSEDRL